MPFSARSAALLLFGLALPMAAQAQDPRLAETWRLDIEADRLLTAGDVDGAEAQVRESLTLCDALGPQVAFCLVPARLRQGTLAAARGDHQTAQSIWRSAIDLAATAYPPQSSFHAFLRLEMARDLLTLDRTAEAELLLREALPAAQANLKRKPTLAVNVLVMLAGALHQSGRYAEAEQIFQDAAHAITQSGYADPILPEIVASNRAINLQKLHRDAEAETLLRGVLASRETRLGPENVELAGPLDSLAQSLQQLRRMPEAEAAIRRAVALYQRPPRTPTSNYAIALNTLGSVLLETGHPDQAVSVLSQALQMQQAVGQGESRSAAIVTVSLGAAEWHFGRLKEAERLLRSSFKLLERGAQAGDPELLQARITLGFVLCEHGSLEESSAIGVRAATEATAAGLDSLAGRATLLQGNVAQAAAQPDAAAVLLERARTILAATTPADPWLPHVLRALAATQVLRRDLPAAVQTLAQGIALHEQAFGTQSLPVAYALEEQAYILLDLQRRDEAEAAFRRSAEIARAEDHRYLALAYAEAGLAFVAARSGRRQDSGSYLAQALEAAGRIEAETPLAAGQLYQKIAHYLTDTDRIDQAQELAGRAVALEEKADGGGLTLLIGLTDQGNIALTRSDTTAARASYERALTLSNTLYGNGSAATGWILHQLATVARLAGDLNLATDLANQALARFIVAGDQRRIATATNTLAILALQRGRTAEAEVLLDRARAAAQAGFAGPSGEEINILGNLGALRRRQGRIAEAVSLGQETVAASEALFGTDQGPVAALLNLLALAYAASPEPRRAEGLLRRAITLNTAALGVKDPWTAKIAANLGTILLDQGRVSEAEPILTEALAVATAALPPNHPDLAQHVGAMADLRALQGREDEAERLLRQSVDLCLAALGPTDPATAAAQVALADSALRAGRIAEAEAAYRQALTVQQAALGEQNGMVAVTLTRIGNVLLSRGHMAEAEDFHQRAVMTAEATFGGESPTLANALDGLARQRAMQNRDAEAVALARRSLAIRVAAYGAESIPAFAAQATLADFLVNQGQRHEAGKLYQSAIEGVAQRLPGDSLVLNEMQMRFGLLLTAEARFDTAKDQLQTANAGLHRAFGADSPRTANAVAALATWAMARGDNALFLVLSKRALALREAGAPPDSPAAARALLLLGWAYLRNVQPDDAAQALHRAADILAAAGNEDIRAGMQLVLAQAALAVAQHDYPSAEALLLSHQETIAKARPGDFEALAAGLNNLGLVRVARGLPAEAIPLFVQAKTKYEAINGHDHPAVATVLLNLAEAQEATGETAQAAASLDEALAILRSISWGERMPERWL